MTSSSVLSANGSTAAPISCIQSLTPEDSRPRDPCIANSREEIDGYLDLFGLWAVVCAEAHRHGDDYKGAQSRYWTVLPQSFDPAKAEQDLIVEVVGLGLVRQ